MTSKSGLPARITSVVEAKKEWWWFDPDYRLVLNDVAESWELLRRTNRYRSDWHIFRHGDFRAELDKKLAEEARGELSFEERVRVALVRAAYLEKLVEVVGREIQVLLMAECDPALPWSALSDKQRESIEFSSPLLPRQRSPGEDDTSGTQTSGMQMGIGEVIREDHDNILLVEKWLIFPSQSQLPQDFARLLRSEKQQTFIVLEFDLGLGRKALYQQLDHLLLIALKLKQGQETQRRHQDETGKLDWETISDDGDLYPATWPRPDQYSLPSRGPAPQMIPSNLYPRVWCWFSAPLSIAQLRKQFHSLLKSDERRRWTKQCQNIFKEEYESFCKRMSPTARVLGFGEFKSLHLVQSSKAFSRSSPDFALSAFDCSLQVKDPVTKLLVKEFLKKFPSELAGKSPYSIKEKRALLRLWNWKRRTEDWLKHLEQNSSLNSPTN